MRLKLLLPTHIEIDEDVSKVTAEAVTGAFTLLPRHLDYVAPLVPGILSYEGPGGESFVAINGGILVKTGEDVCVAVTEAAAGADLATLETARHAIGTRLSILAPDEEEAMLREAGFSDVSLFYAGLSFKGWLAYAG